MAKLTTVKGPILMQIHSPLLCIIKYGSHVRTTIFLILILDVKFQLCKINFRPTTGNTTRLDLFLIGSYHLHR